MSVLFAFILSAGMATHLGIVPGGCTEPASQNVGRPGCYMAAEITLDAPPARVYWTAHTFPTAEAASAEAKNHRWAVTTESHGRYWLHVIAARPTTLQRGERIGVVGPLSLERGKPVRARFLESIFTPGMRTSVHSHPGPEGFIVLEGSQCMETPTVQRMVPAGNTFSIPAHVVHFQSAPDGRRNVALVFYPPDQPWMKMESGWMPTSFCDR